jgi:hypothetical protein
MGRVFLFVAAIVIAFLCFKAYDAQRKVPPPAPVAEVVRPTPLPPAVADPPPPVAVEPRHHEEVHFATPLPLAPKPEPAPPATLPTSNPVKPPDFATLTTAVRVAKAKAAEVERAAAMRISARPELAKLSATADALAKKLELAREKGTPQEKLDASAAWNRARIPLEQARAPFLDKDPSVIAARATVEARQREYLDACAAFPDEASGYEAAIAEARQREYAKAHPTKMAVAVGPAKSPYYVEGNHPKLPLITLDDDDGPRSSAAAGGPVHVKGYFRRDGTYVAPYNRSRPRR